MDDPTSLIENHEFITDCARYAEGLLSEQDVKKKHHFDDATWERLGNNDALIEAIEAEKIRRIRNGSTARERAQVLFAQAPDVLGDILHDDGVSPRHKIESARELRQIAANGPEATPATDRFQIIINLGADVVERYDKSIAVNPNDVDPFNDVGATPQGLLTVIAAKKNPPGTNVIAMPQNLDRGDGLGRLEGSANVVHKASVGAVADEERAPASEDIYSALTVRLVVGGRGVRRRFHEFIITRPKGKLVGEILRFHQVNRRVPGTGRSLIAHIKCDFGGAIAVVGDEKQFFSEPGIPFIAQFFHRQGGRLPGPQAIAGITAR
jgi:hypothetical protein